MKSRNQREGKFIGFKYVFEVQYRNGTTGKWTYYYRGHLGEVYRDVDEENRWIASRVKSKPRGAPIKGRGF